MYLFKLCFLFFFPNLTTFNVDWLPGRIKKEKEEVEYNTKCFRILSLRDVRYTELMK